MRYQEASAVQKGVVIMTQRKEHRKSKENQKKWETEKTMTKDEGAITSLLGLTCLVGVENYALQLLVVRVR